MSEAVQDRDKLQTGLHILERAEISKLTEMAKHQRQNSREVALAALSLAREDYPSLDLDSADSQHTDRTEGRCCLHLKLALGTVLFACCPQL